MQQPQGPIVQNEYGYYDPQNQQPLNQNNNDPFGSSDPAGFSDIRIRHGFIRKVYCIVSLQMFITTIITAAFYLLPPISGFFQSNVWMLYLIMIGTMIIMFVLICFESVARKHPINLIILIIFTVLESFLVGAICSTYSSDTVLIAIGITLVVVVGLTIFAFQTKIDFTGYGTYLFVFALILFLFGILAMVIRNKILHIVYAALGAGIFSMYLVFDTQLMLGGKKKLNK